jgi:hypothetical protein
MASHSWTCPACGRRVPLRAEACHCGMPRARAEELAAAAAAAPAERRPPRRTRQVSPGRFFAALPPDVKTLAVGAALVMVAGFGWMVFGPRRPPSTPALLGWVDPGPPPVPKPTPTPRPPLKLPWWR